MGSQDGVDMAVKTEVLGEWSQTSDETHNVEDRMWYCSGNGAQTFWLSDLFCHQLFVLIN